MSNSANKHRRYMEFKVGAFVWLKLQPYRQHSVAKPLSAKLGRRFYGPYEILERVGPVAYKLRLPKGSRIHNVFHESLLRAFVADDPVVPLPERFKGDRPVVHPVAILDSQIMWHKGAAMEHVLVRWSDGTESPSWEPLAEIRKRFPTIPLEGKVVAKEGGVVTDTPNTEGHAIPSRETLEELIMRSTVARVQQPSTAEVAVGVESEESGKEETMKANVEGRKLRPREQLKPLNRLHDFVAK